MQHSEYALNAQSLYECLEQISSKDHDSASTDAKVRKYYGEHRQLVWVDSRGLIPDAGTLLSVLRREVPMMGFSERAFMLGDISDDISRFRRLDFSSDSRTGSVNQVLARLEFNLTKAYMRYAQGQRYGFIDPHKVLNGFEPSATDSTGKALAYRRLYDVETDRPDGQYMDFALGKVRHDSLAAYLAEIALRDPFYQRMASLLPDADETRRRKLLVNMERRRWREADRPEQHAKFVVVNVPAFRLWAVDGDSVLDMRTACGAVGTKTPLLSSYISRMDVNPEWLIPSSIIRNDIARHAGNPDYFSRRSYYIVNRQTGQRVSAASVSRDQLLSGRYRVAQSGGAGNSLGRIIFRFPNNFSVYLHDTSSPNVFNRDNRAVSHGCVRVQRPFDLAQFMFDGQPDEWMLDKLRISMDLCPETDQGREYMADTLKRKHTRLVHSLPVSPRVPIYIMYYTIFPDPVSGQLLYFPDVYGYDRAISRSIDKFTR